MIKTNQQITQPMRPIVGHKTVRFTATVHPFVDQHPAVSQYLSAPATYYERAFQGGERDIMVLKLLNRADAVSLEVRRWMAIHPADWQRLDRALDSFLTQSASAAQTLIPQVLDQIQHQLLRKEWYELMDLYQQVRAHVEQKVTVQLNTHAKR